MDIDGRRARIDAIDERLQRLLNDRAQAARDIGHAKAEAGAGDRYKPGGEAEVLRRIIARNEGPLEDELEVNMTRIESRPSRRQPWGYHFFVDLEGHQEDERVGGLLARLRDEAAYCKVLGSYPVAVV